ncbi:MAG: PQQ-binding-like beta-propeller repeat protein [Treponema sp.]|jgi:outer membrane protein assembly factor BamB|nr:PQQ-binding-like beta-propeller repeat protein [Treponema sp.]
MPHRPLLLCLFCGAGLLLYGASGKGDFSPEEGEQKALWRQALGGYITGVPTIQAGSVVAVLDGGQLKAYTLEGKFLWEYYTRSKLAPYVNRSREGTCYVSTADGTLVAVNRAGRELWRIKTGPLSSPVLSGWDGRIFVPAGKRLFCYTASGFQLWSRELEYGPALGPLMDKRGGMTAVLENGDLLEISPFGEIKTKALGEIPAAIVPAEGGTLVCFKNGGLRFIGRGGAEKRLPNLRGKGVSAAGGVSRGNRAVLILNNGKVVQISLPEGRTVWTGESHMTEVSGEVSVVYDGEGIYVLSPSGASGFTEKGKRLWVLRINGSDSIPVLSGGILFSGGRDWILYAYQVENRPAAENRSLYGPAPEGSYGLGNPPARSVIEYTFLFDEAEIRLGAIAEKIRTGSIGEDEGAHTAYLMEIAGSSLNPRTPVVRPPVHVKQRSEAAGLLGFIGSRETIPFLTAVFSGDPDPAVKAAAAEAIGRIGVDPAGTALEAFAQSAAAGDEQVLIAAAAATGALCRFSGPPLSDSGIRFLLSLGRDFMPTRVRTQVKRELDSLR